MNRSRHLGLSNLSCCLAKRGVAALLWILITRETVSQSSHNKYCGKWNSTTRTYLQSFRRLVTILVTWPFDLELDLVDHVPLHFHFNKCNRLCSIEQKFQKYNFCTHAYNSHKIIESWTLTETKTNICERKFKVCMKYSSEYLCYVPLLISRMPFLRGEKKHPVHLWHTTPTF